MSMDGPAVPRSGAGNLRSCFMWIFLGAPYVERLRSNRGLNGALTAITAAVVGVILNLAVWFALHVLFTAVREIAIGWVRLDVPQLASMDFAALALTAIAIVALFHFELGMIVTLAGCAAAGVIYGLAV